MMLRNFFRASMILFISMIMVCSLVSFHAYANAIKYPPKINKGDIFSRFKKPMPDIKLMSDEEFRKVSKPIKKKPYGLDVLEYTIRIPKGWTEMEDRGSSNFILSEKIFLDLNVFYGKPTPGGRSRIEIEALNIEDNLTAEQWYLKYILKSGYITEGFITYNEKKVESLIVTMEDDISYYIRTLVLFNGDKILMVKYFVPSRFIKEQAVMQAQVLQSFELLNDVEKTGVEMLLYRFLDIAEMRYPATWEVFAAKSKKVDRMDVSFINIHRVPGKMGKPDSISTEGKLNISVLATSHDITLIDQVKKYRQKIEVSGMLIGDKIATIDVIKYDDNMDFAITEVYNGTDSTNNLVEYELWFTVMVGGNYYYLFMLFTPSRNEKFGIWAENTQNYKEILKSFYPMSGAFLERDY